MKSTVDWNEIVPMLPKQMRDSLWLEAVTILSSGHTVRKREIRPPGVHPANKGQARYWKDTPEGRAGAILAGYGRHYRINKGTVHAFRADGAIGKVWKLLVESKNDHITFEGIAAISKGQKLKGANVVAQLWSKSLIDVMEPLKKVAIAE